MAKVKLSKSSLGFSRVYEVIAPAYLQALSLGIADYDCRPRFLILEKGLDPVEPNYVRCTSFKAKQMGYSRGDKSGWLLHVDAAHIIPLFRGRLTSQKVDADYRNDKSGDSMLLLKHLYCRYLGVLDTHVTERTRFDYTFKQFLEDQSGDIKERGLDSYDENEELFRLCNAQLELLLKR